MPVASTAKRQQLASPRPTRTVPPVYPDSTSGQTTAEGRPQVPQPGRAKKPL